MSLTEIIAKLVSIVENIISYFNRNDIKQDGKNEQQLEIKRQTDEQITKANIIRDNITANTIDTTKLLKPQNRGSAQLPDIPTDISNDRRSQSTNKSQPEAANGEDYRTQHYMGELLQIAQKEIGVTEIAGKGNNKRIVEYHEQTTLGKSDDSTPWCSSFINWVTKQLGIEGTNSPAARSWLNWGRQIIKPYKGCIVILKRGTKSWQGHVGFYMGETEQKIKVLGGNQNNQVNISHYDKSKVLGYREAA